MRNTCIYIIMVKNFLKPMKTPAVLTAVPTKHPYVKTEVIHILTGVFWITTEKKVSDFATIVIRYVGLKTAARMKLSDGVSIIVIGSVKIEIISTLSEGREDVLNDEKTRSGEMRITPLKGKDGIKRNSSRSRIRNKSYRCYDKNK